MSESKTFEELFFSYNADTHYSVESLKILLISNINSNTLYLERIKEWQLQQNIYFDVILFIGNFISEVSEDKKYNSEYICKCEAKIATIVAFIENLTIPLIYFGGKNDPQSLFSENPPNFTIKSKNCFNSYYKLTDDLYIIGQGGYIDEDEISTAEKYSKISEDFEEIKKKIEEENSTPNIKYIFLTFDEPKTWLLSDENKDSNDIEIIKGVPIYYNTLTNDKNIIINIHQNYKLEGINKYKDISVINPGQLENGHFAILDLDRDKDKNKIWKIKNIQFISL